MNRFEIDHLLIKIAHGDNNAFEQLYIKTKRGVYAFLYSYFHNLHDTEDAMQSVYLKIKRGIQSYKPHTNGSAWILQIAKNHALNELKRQRPTESFDLAFGISGEKDITYSDSSGILKLMRELLSEEEERIVTLHVLWGYRHREIANQLDIPVGTVTSKYKRAIEKLKNELSKNK